MKLNPDCVRAVMLEIEKTWEIGIDDRGNLFMGSIGIEHLYEAIKNFDNRDIFYSVYNLDQIGYIDATIRFADGGIVYHCAVNHMTFEGHEFLNSIRDEDNWAGIKKGMTAIRNYSLDAISSIASGIAQAGISVFLEKLNL